MNIIGAGLAGLIAGHVFRSRSPIIYEAQPSLPRIFNNSIGGICNAI